MVDIAIKTINLKGSINKIISCNIGRNVVNKQDINKAVNKRIK